MSGGRGCQQIKVFVFRPDCGTLSPLSPSLSPCVSYFISLPPLSVFLFPFFAIVQSPALPLLNWNSPSLLQSLPSVAPVFCVHVQDAVWWDWSLLMKPASVCMCLCMCTSERDDAHLCWWSHWECEYVPAHTVCVFVVDCAAWWGWSLLMKLLSESLQTFAHYQRRDKCPALEGDWDRRKDRRCYRETERALRMFRLRLYSHKAYLLWKKPFDTPCINASNPWLLNWKLITSALTTF